MRFENVYKAFSFLDGNHAIPECIDDPFPGGISTDDTPQYGIHDACELDTTTDISLPGPSHSISFITDISTTTKGSTFSTLPIE